MQRAASPARMPGDSRWGPRLLTIVLARELTSSDVYTPVRAQYVSIWRLKGVSALAHGGDFDLVRATGPEVRILLTDDL
jgi:hypothetical protein